MKVIMQYRSLLLIIEILSTLACSAVKSLPSPPKAQTEPPPTFPTTLSLDIFGRIKVPWAIIARVDLDTSPTLVIPLPSRRSAILRADVNVDIVCIPNVSISDIGSRSEVLVRQISTLFDRNTNGDELRFVLTGLPSGRLVARPRARTFVETETNGVRRVDLVQDEGGQTQFEGPSGAPPCKERSALGPIEIAFAADKATPQDESRTATEIEHALKWNKIQSARADCYASQEGGLDYNMKLSEKRCSWFEQFWAKNVFPVFPVKLTTVAKGEWNGKELATERPSHRVVIITLEIQ